MPVVTLAPYPDSDVFAGETTVKEALTIPSKEEMWDLYEHGKNAVLEQLDHLERKILAGSQARNPVHFRPIKVGK